MRERRSFHANSQVAGMGEGMWIRVGGGGGVSSVKFISGHSSHHKKNWLKFDIIGEFKTKSCEDRKSALFVQVLLSLHILEEKEKNYEI